MVEIGKLGFVWFFGVVEDVEDPLQSGRVKVRAYHFYSPNSDVLPTTDLPWAHVVMPTTSASYQGKGWSPTFLRKDSTVFGFFVDGNGAQMPVVLGTLPGIPQPDPDFVDVNNLSTEFHDVSKLARGENKLGAVKTQLRDIHEPGSMFNARYPHNKVFESERGHVLEMDDTPGAERIHVYHNQGSYMEMSTGMRVDKTNGTSFDVSSVAKFTKSAGYIVSYSNNATTIYAGKEGINIVTPGVITMSGAIINMTATAGINMNAGGVINQTAVGAVTVQAGGLLDLRGGLGVTIKSSAALSITTPQKMSLSGLAGLYLNSPIPA